MIPKAFCFFIILHSCVASIFDRNFTAPYVLKKKWVQNFIKFEYTFEGKRAKITPIGCVPSNTEDGAVLASGEQFRGHDFVFACAEGEDGVLNYEAIACVDAYGSQMGIGETRKLSNGTAVMHCNIFGGALKKVVERAAGCYFNESIYGEDQQWVEPIVKEFRLKQLTSSDMSDVTLSGRLMQCFRPHFSYYESHVIGCVVDRLGLRIGEFAEYNGTFIKCVENELGQVSIERAELESLSCEVDGRQFPHDSKWNDTKRSAEMYCSYNHVIKRGCLVDNQVVGIGQELKISNGCIYLCHPQTNVYICDEALGDFKIIDEDVDIKDKLMI
ncbi:unnamed protein product [Auanema sp. JU1783]|nr:unnamed protein product [Auanema sp. JU1783]